MVFGAYMDFECNTMSEESEIDVSLEYFLDETLESPDVATVESILLEALGLFEEDNG